MQFNAQQFNNAAAWGTQQMTSVGWKGHYIQAGQRDDMRFNHFQIDFNGAISGSGSDTAGQFNLQGRLTGTSVQFVKQYPGSHSVNYNGQIHNGVITGQWTIPGNCDGTFELRQDAPQWRGFFMYNGQQQPMGLRLNVQKPYVYGVGEDENGGFTIRGQYDGSNMNFIKQYHGKHSVQYAGQVQHNGQNSVVTGFW